MPPAKQYPVVREVQLRDDQDLALRHHAAALGVPVAELIRRLIDTSVPGLAGPQTKEEVA